MNKHTEGPWEVKHSESKNAWNIVGTQLGGRYKLARCPYIVEPRMTDKWNESEKAEQLANATLMGMAPELLEELESMLVAVETMKCPQNAYDVLMLVMRFASRIERAKTVIKKARGQNE